MKIGFVGNTFHDKTRSSIFFKEILETLGEVQSFNADNTGREIDNEDAFMALLSGRFDLIVCWQCEHFVERLFPHHTNIINIPMWDAARMRPAEYWKKFRTIRTISFSRALHEQLQRIGCPSYYFQYFPDPDAYAPVTRDEEVWRRGFFWERRPEEPWNAHAVAALAERLGLSALHVHSAPDYGVATQDPHTRLALSRSAWFDKVSELDDLILRHGVFFAPRDCEGIGQAFLEAMCRGQAVVSPDMSTMNDYITDGVNGVLVKRGAPPDLSTVDVEAIGAAARRYCQAGRQTWIDDLPRLVSLLDGSLHRAPYRERIDTAAVRRARDVVRLDGGPAPFISRSFEAVRAPLISIITTIRDAGDDLRTSLASVAQQGFDDFEIIIGDSFSKDAPRKIVEHYEALPIRYFYLDDHGIYDGINRCVAQARGEYVFVLNAGDVFYDSQVLEKVALKLISERPDFLFGAHIYTDKTAGVTEYRGARPFQETLSRLEDGDVDLSWFKGFPSHQATFTARRMFAEDCYDTRYRIAADHDFLLRHAKAGASTLLTDTLIACYEGGGFSSQFSDLCQAEWQEIYHRMSLRPDRIDDLFEPETGFRFGPENGNSPVILAGAHPTEGPYPEIGLQRPFAWVVESGLVLKTPAVSEPRIYRLHGFTANTDQVLFAKFSPADDLGAAAVDETADAVREAGEGEADLNDESARGVDAESGGDGAASPPVGSKAPKAESAPAAGPEGLDADLEATSSDPEAAEDAAVAAPVDAWDEGPGTPARARAQGAAGGETEWTNSGSSDADSQNIDAPLVGPGVTRIPLGNREIGLSHFQLRLTLPAGAPPQILRLVAGRSGELSPQDDRRVGFAIDALEPIPVTMEGAVAEPSLQLADLGFEPGRGRPPSADMLVEGDGDLTADGLVVRSPVARLRFAAPAIARGVGLTLSARPDTTLRLTGLGEPLDAQVGARRKTIELPLDGASEPALRDLKIEAPDGGGFGGVEVTLHRVRALREISETLAPNVFHPATVGPLAAQLGPEWTAEAVSGARATLGQGRIRLAVSDPPVRGETLSVACLLHCEGPIGAEHRLRIGLDGGDSEVFAVSQRQTLCVFRAAADWDAMGEVALVVASQADQRRPAARINLHGMEIRFLPAD